MVALALAAAACAPPGSPGSGATGDMVQAINQDRGAAGLGGVAWDNQLARLAQSHAQEIAASGSLWHSDLGGWLTSPWMAGWRSLGENLIVGPPGTNAWSVEDSWMDSAPHRANILNGGFNRVGVGVTVVPRRPDAGWSRCSVPGSRPYLVLPGAGPRLAPDGDRARPARGPGRHFRLRSPSSVMGTCDW